MIRFGRNKVKRYRPVARAGGPLKPTITARRRVLHRLAAGSLVVILLSNVLFPLKTPASASDLAPPRWKTGDPFAKQLTIPVGIHWSGRNTLRKGLTNLARSQQICILLDRRIDPGQQVQVSMSDAPLGDCLTRIADKVHAKVCYLGPTVYLAPTDVASILPTLAAIKRQQVQKLPKAVRHRMLHKRVWGWEDLTTPQELLGQLAEESPIPIKGINSIPHDLWPAANLPPLALVDRLTLVTAAFDRTIEFDAGGDRVRIVTMPRSVALTRTYHIASGSEWLAEQVRKDFPAAVFEQAERQLTISGSWQDHRRIQSLLSGKPSPVPLHRGTGRKVYTVNVEGTVAQLIHAVAPQIGLEADLNMEIRHALRRRIRVEVDQASTDELLHAILDPADLDFKIIGDRLEIIPSPKN